MTELSSSSFRWSMDDSGFWLHLNTQERTALQFLEGVKPYKAYDITITEHRKRRSMNANAYLWVLLEKLAAVMHTDKDSVYLLMLDRYGVFTHLIVKPSVVERVKATWRTVRELGEVTVGGQTGVQLQCYFGSSTYDTAEMARLIDGVVSECKELGIETMPPDELDRMKGLWGNG